MFSIVSLLGTLGKLLNTVLNMFREKQLMDAGEARGAAKGLAKAEEHGQEHDRDAAAVDRATESDLDKELMK